MVWLKINRRIQIITQHNISTQYNAQSNTVSVVGKDNVGIFQGTVDKRPIYKDVDIVRGSSSDNFIPLHYSQDQSTITKSFEILGRLLSGEQIEPDKAFGEIFSIQTPINSGTAVEILFEKILQNLI